MLSNVVPKPSLCFEPASCIALSRSKMRRYSIAASAQASSVGASGIQYRGGLETDRWFVFIFLQ
jgi:hypothetical protein